MHSNMISTAVPICSLPCWHSELHQSMPSSRHLLSSCTNASLGPPFLPKSTTLTQQPCKFTNRSLPIPMPSSHRLTNTANLSHPCILVSPLPCMTPFWIPATVVFVLPKDSYHVCTNNGVVYCCTR